MKKIIRATILTALLIMVWAVTALAAPSDGDWNVINGRDDLHVTYKGNNTWDSNLEDTWDDPLSNIQPGDKVVLSVKLINENEEDTLWYMENTVLKTLEEGSDAADGVYTYVLRYTNPAGVTEDIYNSDVGGEDSGFTANGKFREGLLEATNGLENVFYLDTLKKGEQASVSLEVSLDGETQGNSYQNTLAQLQLLFGAEEGGRPAPEETTAKKEETKKSEETTKKASTPQTNDTTGLLPYMILIVASGVAILIAAIVMVKRRRDNNAKGE